LRKNLQKMGSGDAPRDVSPLRKGEMVFQAVEIKISTENQDFHWGVPHENQISIQQKDSGTGADIRVLHYM
jgi:hypothetical protein